MTIINPRKARQLAKQIATEVFFVVIGNRVLLVSLNKEPCQICVDSYNRMNPLAKVKPKLVSKTVNV